MDVIYEQQILNAISYLNDDNAIINNKEIMIMQHNSIVDFYGKRGTEKEFGRIDESEEFG